MSDLVQRIGFPQLVQIIIECWNEVFLLLLLIVMFIGIRNDSKSELTRSVKIPFTWELIVFYGATFLYNMCDIMDISFGGLPAQLSYFVIRCGVFVYYAVGGFMTIFYLQILKRHIAEKLGMKLLKALLTAFQFLQTPLFLMLAITPFTGILYRFTDANSYTRAFGYYIWQTVTILTFIFIAIVIIAEWRKIDHFMKEVTFIATVFPTIGIIGGMFIPLSLNNMLVSVTALILFLIYEKNKNLIILKRTQELKTAKAELAESRLTMMLSQIKPHFIYNSMNAIMELCYTEPERAADTIAHFSDYLRGKLNAFDSKKLAWFDDELELIKEYLSIEYADRNKVFRVQYDLSRKDFRLPALTVQPLVENAVKHGIDRYSADSLVQIITCEDAQSIYIKVMDNGTAEQGDDSLFAEERGIGIRNVTERLRMMCCGDLRISRTEAGTTATITIPKHQTED